MEGEIKKALKERWRKMLVTERTFDIGGLLKIIASQLPPALPL